MNLTSDQAACLGDVLRDPSDDTPRRLYADACRDAGDDARGEFIDVQVRLAELGGECLREPTGSYGCRILEHGSGIAPCEACALKRRERELLAGGYGGDESAVYNWLGWAGAAAEVIPHGAIWSDHATFRRGFVAEITCDWPACRDHLDAVRREQPVEKCVLTSEPEVEERYSADGFGEWSLPGSNLWIGVDDVGSRRKAILKHLHIRWGKTPELGAVAFELPPEPVWRNYTMPYTEVDRDELLRLMRVAARHVERRDLLVQLRLALRDI